MHRAVCPGSFDPVTRGHLDIVSRAARLFDEVVVAILVNETKHGLFSIDERVEMLDEAVRGLGLTNVTVESFSGLLVDFCRANEVDAIVKGLRAGGDFDFELQMAQMNQSLSGIDTVFVPTSPEWAFLASSLVKEVARFGGDVSAFVPAGVVERLRREMS
jgi:pantetheine-phosphate adenylyltransferase